jgi:hypothetical protein
VAVTDVEQRLRAALDAVAPDGLDPSGLAGRARQQARRTRRRAVTGVAATFVAVVAIGLGVSWAAQERVATLPGERPSSARVDPASLCDREAGPYRGLVEPLGDARVLAVLCPDDPRAASWSGLPAPPMAVEGDALDLFVPDLGGPPAEQCTATGPFAGFRVVMLHPDGSLEQVSDDGRCQGRYVVQSFYTAYAEQRLSRPDPTSEAVARRCDPLRGWSDTLVPARVPDPADVREVVACVHGAWAPVEVADVPRYRPVTATAVPADAMAPLLAGLDRANVTVGQLEDCPWRGDVVVLRIRTDEQESQDVVLQCDSLSSPTGTVRWLALGSRAQSIVRHLVDAAHG